MTSPERIDLTPTQQKNLHAFIQQIQAAENTTASAKQGINAMLSAIAECRGASPEASYGLSEDSTALILQAEKE